MRLVSLAMQNFRQHAETRVIFDSGLTGIIGPNGSGKTTILEAIAWALYGTDAARGKVESIRWARAKARASVCVELDFELGNHRYHVVRGLTRAEVYLDGGAEPVASTTTGVNDFLQRRLGMTRGEFFTTYFTGQKELNVMAAMKPAERTQFVSRVLGYERLKSAQELARARRNMLAQEVKGMQAALPDRDAVERAVTAAAQHLEDAKTRAASAVRRRADAGERLSSVTPRWEQAQLDREQVRKLESDLTLAATEESSLRRDAQRVARELAEATAASGELERLTSELAPLPALAAELKRLDALSNAEGRRQALLESQRALRDELARLAERRARLERAPELEREAAADLAARHRALEEAQQAFDAAQGAWVRDQQEATTKLEQLRREWTELKQQRDQIVVLGPNSPCPTCTRPLGDNFRTLVDDFDDKIATLKVDGTFYGQRVAQLATMPDDVAALEERRRTLTTEVGALERKVAKCQSAVSELQQLDRDISAKQKRAAAVDVDIAQLPSGYDAARHAAVRRQVDQLKPLEARAARSAAMAERAPELGRQRDRVTAALERVVTQAAQLRARRDASEFTESGFAALRLEHERAAAELRGAELAAVGASGEVATAEGAVAAAEAQRAELARMRETLRALQADRRVHDELDRAYSELRQDLNAQLRPELSELASAFLEELTDARYSQLDLDDQYNVVVLEDGTPKPVISGGEEDLANLVLRLAISQMIAERAGQSFSLLILDEVFGSLDESRRSNVIELLRGLHDRFEQVILITHIEGVREGLDRVITVRYDDDRGASVVEQSDGVVPFGDPLADDSTQFETLGAAD